MAGFQRPDTPTVLVCGSIHQDTLVLVDGIPQPGQTIITKNRKKALGGKGANQATAAALAGARSVMAATVGEDPAADAVLAELAEKGVDVESVQTSWDEPTGTAFIVTDDEGDPIIFVSSGANALTDPSDYVEELGGADVLLAQGELRPEATEALAMMANLHGTRFILNLSPVTVVSAALIDSADPLIVNEDEAWEVLRGLGAAAGVRRGDVPAIARLLLEYCASVVITGSAKGCVYARAEVDGGDGVIRRQPAVTVAEEDVVDSTGAGDAFSGTLAAELARGAELADAVKLATAAGAMAVRAVGATASFADEPVLRGMVAGGDVPEADEIPEGGR
ncbi:PfkB family carbohydrate kinase [Corynebacterium sp. 335C]